MRRAQNASRHARAACRGVESGRCTCAMRPHTTLVAPRAATGAKELGRSCDWTIAPAMQTTAPAFL